MTFTMIRLVFMSVTLFALLLDLMQSLQISLHPDKWEEHNKFLGLHPDPFAVLSYFTVWAWIIFMVAMKLPGYWSLAFSTAVLIFEAVVVWKNWKAGIPFK